MTASKSSATCKEGQGHVFYIRKRGRRKLMRFNECRQQRSICKEMDWGRLIWKKRKGKQTN
jgi:hypothetical protein